MTTETKMDLLRVYDNLRGQAKQKESFDIIEGIIESYAYDFSDPRTLDGLLGNTGMGLRKRADRILEG